jgi:hypothetical protein
VQTCRGSHTHTVLEDPKDKDNVYIYVSGSAGIRSPNELAGCAGTTPEREPELVALRIEIIKVPLANPAPRRSCRANIFAGLSEPPRHGPRRPTSRRAAAARACARAASPPATRSPADMVVPPRLAGPLLDSIVKARGGSGAPTAADSAALRAMLQGIINRMFAPRPASPCGERPARSATTSPCTRRSAWPAAPVRGTACCSTSAIR